MRALVPAPARTVSPHCRHRCSARCSTSSFRLERSPAQDRETRARTAFHLAIPVHSLAAARDFYGGVLGFPEGRSSERWVDYNAYGHQLVCHLVDGWRASVSRNQVDGDPVPVPHFGLALTVDDFQELVGRLEERGARFELEPHLRFVGKPGEQHCAFLFDPSGNAVELKAMVTPDNLFAQYVVS